MQSWGDLMETFAIGGIRVLPVGHSTALEWLWIIIPLAGLVAVITWLIVNGEPDGEHTGIPGWFARSASSLRRLSPLPPWASGGIAMGAWTLGVAVIGFIWDVSWHIDFGRDRQLFTPPHVLILTGLLGIGAAGVFAIGLATVEHARVWRRFGPLHVPVSGLALVVLSGGAAIGFPLDDLWHRAYGIDVTMWGPTHLLMIGGASLTPIALLLLYAEAGGPRFAGRDQTVLRYILAMALMLGLSTFQLEFDLGVPQWQVLYQPVLIALAVSAGLVAARAAFGRGWAVRAAVMFLAARGLLALVIHDGLGHTMPHFPLYIGAALLVEAVFEFTPNASPLIHGSVAGIGAGTIGLATEWGWTHVFGRVPWQTSLLSSIWIAVLVAVAGGVLGVAMGRVLSMKRAAIPVPILIVAGVIVVAGLTAPYPRHGQRSTATIRTAPVGAGTTVVAADGEVSTERSVNVVVTMNPKGAADRADWFVIDSWQGGHLITANLVRTAPGTYRADRPVPTGGSWKSLVVLFKHDVVAAAPVWVPGDLQNKLPVIPVQPVRIAPMARASKLLTRESHGGAAWPAVVAYTGLLGTVLVWLAILVLSFNMLNRREALRMAPAHAARPAA
jgi:hypothetical protein